MRLSSPEPSRRTRQSVPQSRMKYTHAPSGERRGQDSESVSPLTNALAAPLRWTTHTLAFMPGLPV